LVVLLFSNGCENGQSEDSERQFRESAGVGSFCGGTREGLGGRKRVMGVRLNHVDARIMRFPFAFAGAIVTGELKSLHEILHFCILEDQTTLPFPLAMSSPQCKSSTYINTAG
jgi:hypothetical protein